MDLYTFELRPYTFMNILLYLTASEIIERGVFHFFLYAKLFHVKLLIAILCDFGDIMPPVAERLRRAYPALTERDGVGSIPANSDAQNVPSFRRWRFEMKLSPFFYFGISAMNHCVSNFWSVHIH